MRLKEMRLKEMRLKNLSLGLFVVAWACVSANLFAENKTAGNKRIVFLAGSASHGYGSHEHLAGCRILAAAIQRAAPGVKCDVYSGGWPDSDSILDGADAIVMYCDGGARHPALKKLDVLGKHIERGAGFVCLHYGVEVPPTNGGPEFLKWLGGFFEINWSVNPHWTADFSRLPAHPITGGVKPFSANDEWYFHMRFVPEMKGVTPILTAVAPESTMSRKDGTHSGNPAVRAAIARGEPQHTAWAYERPDGGRSFGFTGGHYHWNWGREEILKLVSNAIVWAAKGDVPGDGLPVAAPTLETLEQGQDEKIPANHDSNKIKSDFKISAASQLNPTDSTLVAVNQAPRGARRGRSERTAQESDLELRSPDKAVAGLTVHPELEVKLVASEPELKSLTNLDIDHRGRIWVCEVVNYRRHNGDRPEGDRILILEDTDQDGKSDKTKVFYQGRDIDSAMGICVLGKRVIVSASPNVWIFTDDNGDDVPDRKELFFTKTGDPQHDHSAHSFLFGPDGKLYWNFGNTGHTVHDAKGNIVKDMAGNEVRDIGKPYRNGMPFRCNLDGSEFEVLGYNFRNNYEVTVDSFGTLWQSDNDDDGNRAVRINYVMEFGNYGYVDELTGAAWRTDRTNLEAEIPQRHWHLNDPGVVPTMLITGAGSPTGIAAYEGDLLPKAFRNQIIHCDAGPNVVRAYPVSQDGAGYKADILNLIVGERDQWFRPADVCVAPDGSLFVTDWYDPGVGGHNMQDMERGRLFRVAPPGASYKIPSFDFSTPAGAVAALANPNLSVRYMAWEAIRKFGEKSIAALQQMAQVPNPRWRARAIWALGKLPSQGDRAIQHALDDKDPDLRITGIRLARQLKISPEKYASRVARDPASQVRRELLVALRQDASSAMPKIWAELASQHDGKDRWYLEALGIGSDRRPVECLSEYLSQFGKKASSEALRDVVWRTRAPQAAMVIANMLADPKLPELDVPRMFRALDFHASTDRTAALNDLLSRVAVAGAGSPADAARRDWLTVEAISRSPDIDLSKQGDLHRAVVRYLDRTGSRESHIKLLRKIKLPDVQERLMAIATQGEVDSSAVSAAEMLLRRNQQAAFSTLLNDARDVPRALRTASLLGLCNDESATSMLTAILEKDSAPPELRTEAAKGLTRTSIGAKLLISRARANKLPADVRFVVGSNLRTSGDGAIRREASELFPSLKSAQKDPLPPLSDLVSTKGDATKGLEVFRTKGTCANCHIVTGFGKSVGPDLSEIGGKLTPEAMYVSILDPSAGISHNFEAYAAVLDSGQVITGLLVSKTNEQVVIRDAQGIDRPLNASDIEELKKQPKSLMPDNLHEALTTQELVDIVHYMQSLKKQ